MLRSPIVSINDDRFVLKIETVEGNFTEGGSLFPVIIHTGNHQPSCILLSPIRNGEQYQLMWQASQGGGYSHVWQGVSSGTLLANHLSVRDNDCELLLPELEEYVDQQATAFPVVVYMNGDENDISYKVLFQPFDANTGIDYHQVIWLQQSGQYVLMFNEVLTDADGDGIPDIEQWDDGNYLIEDSFDDWYLNSYSGLSLGYNPGYGGYMADPYFAGYGGYHPDANIFEGVEEAVGDISNPFGDPDGDGVINAFDNNNDNAWEF